MNSQQIKRIIRRYLSGKASTQEQLLVDQWLQAAERTVAEPDARESMHREKLVLSHLLTYVRPHPISEQLGSTKSKTTRLQRIHAARWIAAATVILVAGALYFIPTSEKPVPVRILAASPFSIREVLLPDSSVAVLNSGSSVQYPVKFTGPRREVSITGEVFFKVRTIVEQPFEVKADSLHIRVLGTSFVVKNDQAAAIARVGVTSGKVAVRYEREDFPETTLTPGREIQFDKLNSKITVIGNAPIQVDWTAKRLIFAATPLPEAFLAIAQSYGKVLRYEGSSLHKAFTGSFDRTDALPDVLKVLTLSYGLAIQQNKDGSLTIR